MSRKDAILYAASRLFSLRGFKDTSMGELAKLTGVAQSTIFYHFQNKEGLFLATLKRVKEDIVGQFEEYINNETFENGLEMIEGVAGFYLHLAGVLEDQFLLLHRYDAYEVAEINPECREQLEGIYNYIFDILEQGILLGQDDGTIRGLSPKKMAFILFSMVDGLARLKTYNLYDSGGLYSELMESCRRLLQRDN